MEATSYIAYFKIFKEMKKDLILSSTKYSWTYTVGVFPQ